MPRTKITLESRWIGLVRVVLEEHGLVPGVEHKEPKVLPRGLETEGGFRGLLRIVGWRSAVGIGSVITLVGEFTPGQVPTTRIFCLASDSPESEEQLAAPQLRGREGIPPEAVPNAVASTLAERDLVIERIRGGATGPFHYGGVTWK
jgi:hypothetical protein